jgi:aminotransferase
MSSVDFAYDLLDKQQIAVVPGITYGKGGEGYIRMAYTVQVAKIKEAVDRLREYAKLYS